jgi:ribosome recycling factor
MVKDILSELEKQMGASVEHFRNDLKKIRTGRANINMFEDIKIDYYGAQSPINQAATLGIPEPTLITVQPWDPSFLEAIDKAIRAADLGLNPINDGKMLKIPIPPLDEERRREIAKHIRKIMEDEKTALRNMRREAKDMIELMEKEKEISEDDKFWGIDKIQEIINAHTKKIEDIAAYKEKEILEL